jgi:hypothetical protein
MAIITNMASSFKSELFAAGHCFNAPVVPTANTHSSTTVDTVSAMAGVAVGMTVTGSGIPANTYVAAITSGTAFVLSQAATTSLTTTPLTITGDVMKMALIIPGMSGTYGVASANFTDIVGHSDETSGTGYVSGGTALTNVSPAISGTTSMVSFFPNPSWTSASFSAAGCMIYNSSVRDGGISGTNATGGGRCCSVHDFGGSQTVSSGVFTVLMPTVGPTTSILRIA